MLRSGAAYDVVIVERDPPPPALTPEQAFEQWERPGVPQFRHAHILLARLQTILRDDYPELLAELLAAGIQLSVLAEVLPAGQLDCYQPLPEDRDLLHLWGRRPTFEYVLRRYVERLPNVRFIHSARVERLLTEIDREQGGECVRVTGIEISRDDAREQLAADVVIDASGKRTKFPEQLSALGVKIDVTNHPSDRMYVCRHYRLRDEHAAPRRVGTGANLDYFGYATFYAEHGHYAITLSCPAEDAELARRMSRTEGFEAICARFPVLALWTSLSVPTSKVLGAGGFENRWIRYGARGGRALRGYFALGDSQIETNPIYGRGCASAFVQAKVLAETFAATRDPSQRPARYYRRTRALMQAHFDFCVQTDNMFRSRGRASRGERVPWFERALQWAFERIWSPAIEQSSLVAREMIKAMQMRELSSVSLRLAMVAHIFASFARARMGMSCALRPSEPLGPPRAELLEALPPASDAAPAEAFGS